MDFIYVLMTLLLTVYGQLVLKWQIVQAGALPAGALTKLTFLLRLLLNPWILSGFLAAFMAALCWMAAMTKFELSQAYPFMSLAFVLVTLFSVAFLGEPVTWGKAVGTALVVIGLIVLARSSH